MLKKARSLVIASSSSLLLACGAQRHGGAATDCPAGTRLDPEHVACAPVLDVRASSPAQAVPRAGGIPLPDLASERARRRTGLRSAHRWPVPGGIGAGITYLPGQLKVSTSTSLYTHMSVYPDGVGQLADFLFATATNRAERPLEIVAIYNSAPGGSLGIYDWSCSAASPCQNDVTSPAWIFSQPFHDEPCHYSPQEDGGGHEHLGMYYENSSELVGGTWTNSAYLWNYCSASWDLVYRHDFTDGQRDCSADNSCGWWGPILETFQPNPQPDVAELAFWGTTLVHDGVASALPPEETGWSDPAPGWSLFHRTPNSAFAAGGHVSDLNQPPTVATPASAALDATATAASLSVLGADDGGEENLGYSWAATGPAPVAFGPEAGNAARATTATFAEPGTYTLVVTIRDAYGATATSSVGVTVAQRLTIAVAPPVSTVVTGSTQVFSASGSDQFGAAMVPPVPFTWAASGGGTIDGTGTFTATTAGGPHLVRASAGAVSGTASVTVLPRPAAPPSGGCSSTAAPGAGAIAAAFALLLRRRARVCDGRSRRPRRVPR